MKTRPSEAPMRMYGSWLPVGLIMGVTVMLASDRPDPAQKVLDALQVWLQAATPEKTYVLTDKDIYLAGETIWMSGFVVNGVTHEPGTPSGMLFIDLVDAWGKAWMSPIMKLTYGRGEAQLVLPSNLPPGEYQLRAYTARMKGYDEGFQFKKDLHVLNPGSLPNGPAYRREGGRMVVEMEIGGLDEQSPGGAQARFTLVDPYSGKEVAASSAPIGLSGAVTTSFAVADSLWEAGEPQLEISWHDGRREHRQTFRVPSLRQEPEVRFFPEGGDWVAGIEARVAFQAKGADGRGVPVRGRIEDEQGTIIVPSFESVWQGMGSFTVTPQAGRRYVAVLETGPEQAKRIPLPPVQNAGTTLRVEGQDAAGVQVTIRSSTAREGLLVVAHRRGQVLWAAKSVNPREEFATTVPPGRLGTGVVHFTVFDDEPRPLAERLFYGDGGEGAVIQASMEGSAESFGSRQEVAMDLKLTGEGGPAYPNVAVSVTETEGLMDAGLDFNSWLLLASDLRGGIENASSYLAGDGRAHVDLLMLTHGWRRFAWQEVLEGTFDPLPLAKPGLDVIGLVREGSHARPLRNFDVIVLHENVGGGISEAATDNQGVFRVSDLVLPDSTRILVHAKKRNLNEDISFELEPVHTPRVHSSFLPYPLKGRAADARYQAYLASLRERLAVDRLWGVEMPAYELGEITVTDTRIRDEGYRSQIIGQPDRVLRIQDHAFVGGKAVEYLQRNPSGFRISGSVNDIDVRLLSATTFISDTDCDGERICCMDRNDCPRLGCRPLFLIDGMEADICQVRQLNASEIEAIEILRGANAAIYGSRAFAGVVSFVSRQGDIRPNTSTSGGMVAGYVKARQFYAPDYGVQSDLDRKPDLRSTLFWKSMVSADANGMLHLRFFTGDRTGAWVVQVEGIDELGRSLSYRRTFRVAE